jgi:hypothetical protein
MTKGSTGRKVVLSVCVILTVTLAWFAYQFGKVSLEAAFAEEQVRIFYAMRDQARAASPIQAVGSLDYAADYYPSGTKQTSGSRLDRLVESVRADVCQQIMGELNNRTGERIETVEGWREWKSKAEMKDQN